MADGDLPPAPRAASGHGAHRPIVNVAQGEVFVSKDPMDQAHCVLGSCVATVIWDDLAQVGGMNHLLLPPDERDLNAELGAQVNLMERLINGLLRDGGRRDNLRAKIFGGAKMIDGLSDAGRRNCLFVRRFLADERIPCVAQSLGGTQGRKLKVWPSIGRVLQREIGSLSTVDAKGAALTLPLAAKSTTSGETHETAWQMSGVEWL